MAMSVDRSSRNQETYHGASVLKSAVQDRGRRLDQSEFRSIVEVSFPVLVSLANATRKETFASRE